MENLERRLMNVKLYNEKQSYTVMKLDCMLQTIENRGSCDFNELNNFTVVFRQLPHKTQPRYEHLLESAMDLYSDEEQECY